MLEIAHRDALESGCRLHGHQIEAVLGRGGFGITYLAHDLNLERQVALKEYLPMELAVRDADQSVHSVSKHHEDQYRWGLQRFTDEARTLKRFDHPNILRVHSVFEANNTAYMVMDYEEGESLETVLSRPEAMDEERLLNIALALLEGLEVVHREGFIHRDIKPDNIYVRADGSPVLLDFGSARLAMVGRTRTVTTVVSSGYAPLEQYSSRSDEQGPWTDIYSLGATLYRAVAGEKPVDAVDRSRGILGSTREILVPATEMGRDRYSPGFLAAIDHALELDEQERPQTVTAWRDELLGRSSPPALVIVELGSPSASTVTQSGAETQRPSMWQGMAAGIAVALALGSLAAWWQWGSISSPDRASGPTIDNSPVVEDSRIERLPDPPSSDADAPEAAHQLTEPDADPEAYGRLAYERQFAEERARFERELEQQQTAAAHRDAEARRLAEARAEQEGRAKIARLLVKAEAELKALRLTTPPGNNAFETYEQILELEPDNTVASGGLQRIVQRYVELADQVAVQGDFDKAELFLERAQAVIPDAAVILSASEKLVEARAVAEGEQQAPLEHDVAADTEEILAKDESPSRKESTPAQPPEKEHFSTAKVQKDSRESDSISLAEEPLTTVSRQKPFKIAIFPISTNPAHSAYETGAIETAIQEMLHKLIAKNEAYLLAFSSYLEWTDYPLVTADAIWDGTSHRSPNAERVYELGGKLGVDTVLMYHYERRAFAGVRDTEYSWDGYLFDVVMENVYEQSGDDNYLRANTDQLLSSLVEARNKVSGRKVAILPFGSHLQSGVADSLTVDLLNETISQTLIRFRELNVIYSYYDPSDESVSTEQFNELWTGGFVNPQISKERALEILDLLGADMGITCKSKQMRWFTTVGDHAHMSYETGCSLVDAHRRDVYNETGELRDVGEMTARLIREHFQQSMGLMPVRSAAVDSQLNVSTPSALQPQTKGNTTLAEARESSLDGDSTQSSGNPSTKTIQGPPFRIAILPLTTKDRLITNEQSAESDIQQLLHALIKRNEAFTLTFSSYLEDADNSIASVDLIWEGRDRKTPNAENVYEIGRELDVDSVLMYFYDHFPSPQYSGPDTRYTWQGYLLDMATNRIYHRQGDHTDLRKNTKRLLSAFVEGRKAISTRKVAVLPFTIPTGSSEDERMLFEGINKALKQFTELNVVYTYYDPYEEPLAPGQFDGLWTGGVVNPEISNPRALEIVNQLGVDMAISCKMEYRDLYFRGTLDHEHLNTKIECSLIDAGRRSINARTGVLGNVSLLAMELIKEYLRSSISTL